MAFPEDLLELAQQIADLHPATAHQASLRRAVSTAYYALFHLLITEATANWARPELRATLGRCFDHGPMKTASQQMVAQIDNDLKTNSLKGPARTVAVHLRTVANAFIQAQQRRNDADYRTDKEWTPVEVATNIASVAEAFRSWRTISGESEAQAFLVSLLGLRERRTSEPRTAMLAESKKPHRR
ncbi:MAG TPA: hypothetical protein VME17_05715 [Bryobacteraceae bacterium]|nr:hypothetical protein [Bryobacteraceae bacterium]